MILCVTLLKCLSWKLFLSLNEKLRKVNKANLPFDPETFGYVPYAEDNHKFTMRIKESDEGELMRITDPEPFDPLDPLVLGSLEEKKYNGNWSISR